jgi:hypothetical protein
MINASMTKQALRVTVAEEMGGAKLGDQRRTERLQLITGLLEVEPEKSFPRSMGSDAALEALYRFINNDGFGASDILAPHVAATLERAEGARTVIAIHDTTHVEYGTARADLGPTTGKHHFGFIAHTTLMLAEEDGLPLGVAHLETKTRTGKKWKKRKHEGQRARVQAEDEGRESLRWLRAVAAVETARAGRFDVVHVTDAEGDFFELLASLHGRSGRFVIRAGQLDRVVTQGGETCSLREIADAIAPRAWREVELSERKHSSLTSRSARLRHPERAARTTKLAVGATRIVLSKSNYSNFQAAPFELSIVRVWEPKPPKGQPATEWVLLTTESISSVAALSRIVDIYRKRWVIEEYFKALKSGCSLEKRQVESYEALCKVLALFVPIAHRLLRLRALERADSRARATKAFSNVDLQLMAQAPANSSHPPPRTVADALAHLARLGGHIRNNGRPGWQTLAWGYEKLLLMKLGWEAAMSTVGADKM